jgi:hypothetical protein
MKFNKIIYLKKHFVLECFEKEMEKKINNNLTETNNLNINYNTNNINNIINNTFTPFYISNVEFNSKKNKKV